MENLGIHGQFRLENYKVSRFSRILIAFFRFIGRHDITAAIARKGVQNYDTGFIKNIITNAGRAQIALLAGDATAIPFTYLALGTSSTAVAATDTALGAEISTSGLGRSAGTVSRITTTVTNDTLNVTFTWTASGSLTVQEIGLFNAASTGTILGHALTGSKSVVSSDVFIGTYQVKFA